MGYLGKELILWVAGRAGRGQPFVATKWGGVPETRCRSITGCTWEMCMLSGSYGPTLPYLTSSFLPFHILGNSCNWACVFPIT